jgi:GDP/UDP-N,N'-diacetylbacillosamine 2-epimerase (hydrolysing)
MKIGILTSSRADFGIYLSLLKKLKEDHEFQIEIIAFGTHLSHFHGYTIDQIEAAGYNVKYRIESMLLTDSPSSVATSIGLTTIKFAEFWEGHSTEFDLVFCLGDRYEMFSAVMAGVPFQIPFAHLHGGETTLGAIDNVFRHGITLASKYHFVSTPAYADRVMQLVANKQHIYYVGALSLDNIFDLDLLSIEEFKKKWAIDLEKKTILITFHPETVNYTKTQQYAYELVNAIRDLTNYQVLVTMPNADTGGNIIRKELTDNFTASDRVFLIENLGSVSYFTAMKHCALLLGNTSSGIIEAASFGKYVINLGDRQKGRRHGNNVINTKIEARCIIEAVAKIEIAEALSNQNIYFNNGASVQIIKILKQLQ